MLSKSDELGIVQTPPNVSTEFDPANEPTTQSDPANEIGLQRLVILIVFMISPCLNSIRFRSIPSEARCIKKMRHC